MTDDTLPVAHFAELAGVPVDGETVILASQQVVDVEGVPTPAPLVALGTVRFDENGQPRAPSRPLLIWPDDLPTAEHLIAVAIAALPHAPKKVDEIHLLARDGALAVSMIRPRKRKGAPPPMALLGWLDEDGGCCYLPLDKLALLAELIGKARTALKASGHDPASPGRLN